MLFKKYLITKENRFERIDKKDACGDCVYRKIDRRSKEIYCSKFDTGARCLCGRIITAKILKYVVDTKLYTHTYRAL